MPIMKLYRHALSGHSHRVQFFLSILGLQVELVDIDLAGGAHKKTDFLQKNIFGEVPVLEDGNIILSDSNAILVYLATKYDTQRTWLPIDAVQAAEIQRFLSIAAGKIAFGPAAARAVKVFGLPLDHKSAVATAHAVLGQLETHLQDREWLANNKPSLADVANYTYIAHAPEGDVSLENYPNIRAWLKRIENLSGFVAMQKKDTTPPSQHPQNL